METDRDKTGTKRVKTGGRRKGSRNKASAYRERLVSEGGQTPLAFLVQLMRDESQPLPMRLEAAKAAAPFVHPKLASIEHKGNAENPITISGFSWMTADEARARGWLTDTGERCH